MALLIPQYQTGYSLTALYGGNNLQSLATSSAKAAWYLLNDVAGYSDIRLRVDVKIGNATPTGSLSLMMATSLDGTNFTDNLLITHFNATQTAIPIAYKNNIPLGQYFPSANSEIIQGEVDLSLIVSAIPKAMGFYIINNTGTTLDAAYAHAISLQGIKYEYL